MKCNYQPFFALLRLAMTGEQFDAVPTAEELSEFYQMAGIQSVRGVCFTAFPRLPKAQQPPVELMVRWMGEAEDIRRMNELQNQEATRLTRLFTEAGRRSAILKGQANARLYPDRLSRQVGDIDIWVEGGKKGVVALLMELGLVTELGSTSVDGKPTASYHHVHLPPTKNLPSCPSATDEGSYCRGSTLPALVGQLQSLYQPSAAALAGAGDCQFVPARG